MLICYTNEEMNRTPSCFESMWRLLNQSWNKPNGIGFLTKLVYITIVLADTNCSCECLLPQFIIFINKAYWYQDIEKIYILNVFMKSRASVLFEYSNIGTYYLWDYEIIPQMTFNLCSNGTWKNLCCGGTWKNAHI